LDPSQIGGRNLTAAYLGYSLDINADKEKKVIVIDLGSGTVDDLFLAIDNGIIEVFAKFWEHTFRWRGLLTTGC
jgi:hypothetical protein